MKSKETKKFFLIIVIAAIVIIPVLYSYFYLGAFWDPYSRLDTLPVAIVNNDKGAIINEEKRNVGQELSDELKTSAELKFIFTDEATAKEGTEKDDYYAMIVIPENFSQDIASASTTNKHTATIYFSSNEKRNYLAGQILNRAVLEVEEKIRCKVDAEIVGQLSGVITSVPNQMLQLEDGLGKLQDGSKQLQEGSGLLAEGTKTFQEKFSQYQDGVKDLKEGSDSLTNGTASLDSGIEELLEGAGKLSTSTKDLGQISSGAKTLANSAQKFNDGLIKYTNGVDSLISTVNDTSKFLTQYVTKINPSIMKDPVFAEFIKKLSDPSNKTNIAALQMASTNLKEASEQISAGAEKLSSGCKNLPDLQLAITTLKGGLEKAKAGSANLAAGTKELSEGINKVNLATGELYGAAVDIADGASNLNSGAVELNGGITEAKSGVSDAITGTDEQLASIDGLQEFAEAPVTVKADPIQSVPNYGTAFAPYFMSLSLFVGALIMFVVIYMDADEKFKLLSRNSEHKLLRTFIYLLIGFAQALILAVILQTTLGLKVNNLMLYYTSCCLVSMVFISIVQFLMVHLKDVGKFLSILLLILQLTSCGGTFPMETVPKLFNILYPFMPMTYSVGLFKEAISGEVSGKAAYNITILGIILTVFIALTIMISAIKARKEKSINKSKMVEA